MKKKVIKTIKLSNSSSLPTALNKSNGAQKAQIKF